jgi:methylenetetrahydrofolate reductase (NADPH)
MTLREALASGEFAITCEFVPGRGSRGPTIEAATDFAVEIRKSGVTVHAVSLTDSPGGNPAILPDVLAAEIQKEGLDALVHFSCRDQNRNAMEARAMALSHNGIENVLVVTGDYTESGYGGRATPVFDMDSVQAITYLTAMNAGLEIPGRKPGTTQKLPATNFLIGAGVSPFKTTEKELMPQFFKMERKIQAGAHFLITQLGYDMRKFFEVKRYLAARGLDIPVIGNVYVLSQGAGKAMAAGNVPGCVVTKELLAVLAEEAKAPDKGKAARLERAAGMVAAFRGMGFAGAHIGGFNLKTDDFIQIIQRAEALAPRWHEFVEQIQFGSEGEFYAFPEPTEYVIRKPDPDPLPRLGSTSKSLPYRFARMMHAVLFEPRSPIYKLAQRYYAAIGDKGFLYRFSHGFEWWVKRQVFGCRDCGDCAMMDTAYFCPMHNCAKKLRNGPCGGSCNGMCEAFPDSKRCAWTVIYERLKSSQDLDRLRAAYVPPRNAALENTSGWANYYLGRDHHKQPVPALEEERAGAKEDAA